MIETPTFGTVYGVVLNDHASLRKIGDALLAAPYKGLPQAPAMYIKPANTHAKAGASIQLPLGEKTVEVGATLGLVMGRKASGLTPENALDHVAGVVLAADLSLPHDSYYRPAIREKCFDASLPISKMHPWVDIGQCVLSTEINGERVEQRSMADAVRDPVQLLVDVSAFMTLDVGDVLLIGVSYQAPQAAAGAQVRISAPGLGELAFSIQTQGARA